MVFCILFSVFTVANTNSFYTKQYIAVGAEKATGMSIEDLDKTTAMLLDYLNDRRDDLNLEVEKWGNQPYGGCKKPVCHSRKGYVYLPGTVSRYTDLSVYKRWESGLFHRCNKRI